MQQYTSILLIVVMIIAFYFLIIRPQRKRTQQQQELVRKLEPGARVVTTTGIYATIVAMGDKQVVLETSPGSRVTMLKQAVGRVVRDDEEDADLASYRGTGEPIAQPDSAGEPSSAGQAYGHEQYGSDQQAADLEQGSSSGMAGGSPVQEYAPGSAPDFGAEDQQAPQHETAPWPPQGSSEPAGPYGSGGGSVLGSSSLGAYDEQVRSREDADGDPSAAQQDSDDKKQA